MKRDFDFSPRNTPNERAVDNTVSHLTTHDKSKLKSRNEICALRPQRSQLLLAGASHCAGVSSRDSSAGFPSSPGKNPPPPPRQVGEQSPNLLPIPTAMIYLSNAPLGPALSRRFDDCWAPKPRRWHRLATLPESRLPWFHLLFVMRAECFSALPVVRDSDFNRTIRGVSHDFRGFLRVPRRARRKSHGKK